MKNPYTVKKRLSIFPSPAGVSLSLGANSPWAEIIKLFPPRESLVSDIPVGDGKIFNLFYSVQCIVPTNMQLVVAKKYCKQLVSIL